MLEGNNSEWDDTVFAEYAGQGAGEVCRMVRSGPWKYNAFHGMEPELFNMQDDPGEQNNLAGRPRCRDIEQHLRELALQGWDPQEIQNRVMHLYQERALIADWVRATDPPEQDPLWFSGALENRVDSNIHPVAEE